MRRCVPVCVCGFSSWTVTAPLADVYNTHTHTRARARACARTHTIQSPYQFSGPGSGLMGLVKEKETMGAPEAFPFSYLLKSSFHSFVLASPRKPFEETPSGAILDRPP